jgi:hypothetical protein
MTLKMSTKKVFFIVSEFTSDVKDDRLFRSHNTVEIKVVLIFFACMLGFGAGPEHTNYNGFGSERPKNPDPEHRFQFTYYWPS